MKLVSTLIEKHMQLVHALIVAAFCDDRPCVHEILLGSPCHQLAQEDTVMPQGVLLLFCAERFDTMRAGLRTPSGTSALPKTALATSEKLFTLQTLLVSRRASSR